MDAVSRPRPRGARFRHVRGLPRLDGAVPQGADLLLRIQPLFRRSRGLFPAQRRRLPLRLLLPRGDRFLRAGELDSRHRSLPRLDDGARSRDAQHAGQLAAHRPRGNGLHDSQPAAPGTLLQEHHRLSRLAVGAFHGGQLRVLRRAEHDEGRALPRDENHDGFADLRLRNPDAAIRLRHRPRAAPPFPRPRRHHQRHRLSGMVSAHRQIRSRAFQRRRFFRKRRLQGGTAALLRAARAGRRSRLRRRFPAL